MWFRLCSRAPGALPREPAGRLRSDSFRIFLSLVFGRLYALLTDRGLGLHVCRLGCWPYPIGILEVLCELVRVGMGYPSLPSPGRRSFLSLTQNETIAKRIITYLY